MTSKKAAVNNLYALSNMFVSSMILNTDEMLKKESKVKKVRKKPKTEVKEKSRIPNQEKRKAVASTNQDFQSPDSSVRFMEPEEKKIKLTAAFENRLRVQKDFRMAMEASYRAHNLRELKKRKLENNISLPATTMNQKPFFPNFVDSVKAKQSRQDEHVFPKVEANQSEKVTTTTSVDKHVNKEDLGSTRDAVVIDDDVTTKMMIFFNGLCPKVIFDQRGCNEVECLNTTHEVPNYQHLKKQLLKRSMKSSIEVFNFTLKFSSNLQNRFFPAFIEVSIQRNHYKFLEKLMSVGLQLKLINGFDYILEVMEQQGWTKKKAVNVFIDCHDGTVAAKNEIVKLIINSEKELVELALHRLLSNCLVKKN